MKTTTLSAELGTPELPRRLLQKIHIGAVDLAGGAGHADLAGAAAGVAFVRMFGFHLGRLKSGRRLRQLGKKEAPVASEGAASCVQWNRDLPAASARNGFQLSPDTHLDGTEQTGCSATEPDFDWIASFGNSWSCTNSIESRKVMRSKRRWFSSDKYGRAVLKPYVHGLVSITIGSFPSPDHRQQRSTAALIAMA